MNDQMNKVGGPDHPQAEPIDAKVRRRIAGAVQGELDRLEEVARAAQADQAWQAFTMSVETIASVKARVEMYCIQIEMAVTTAAMASLAGGLRTKQTGGSDPVALVRKADKPGGNSTSVGE